MKSDREVFEHLLRTIENDARDNETTIYHVDLWAKSWREELYRERVYSNEYHPIDWKNLGRAFFLLIVSQVLITVGFLLKLSGY
jgi:hypothetical protein